MEIFSVKQIADMLNTQPETVRRWIRSGKLKAEKTSRKEGHTVTEGDLKKFLKSSPKYTGVIAGAAIGAMVAPVVAIPLVGGIAATYLAASKNGKEYDDPSFSKEDVKRYLHEEIERRTTSINQKMKTIEQLQQEIAMDQQQIAECKFIIDKLESEKE